MEQTGIENLLADETSIQVIREFLEEAEDWEDYPFNSQRPAAFEYEPSAKNEDVRKLCRRVLKARKGSGYAQRLVELCSKEDLPEVIVDALEQICEDLPNGLTDDLPNEDEDRAEEA